MVPIVHKRWFIIDLDEKPSDLQGGVAETVPPSFISVRLTIEITFSLAREEVLPCEDYDRLDRPGVYRVLP